MNIKDLTNCPLCNTLLSQDKYYYESAKRYSCYNCDHNVFTDREGWNENTIHFTYCGYGVWVEYERTQVYIKEGPFLYNIEFGIEEFLQDKTKLLKKLELLATYE